MPLISLIILSWPLHSCIHSRNQNPQTKYKVSKDNYSFFIENSNTETTFEPKKEAFLKQQQKLLSKSSWREVKTLSLSYLEEAPYDRLALEYLCIAVYQLNLTDLATYYIDLLLSLDQNDPVALNLKGLIAINDAQILNDYRMAISYFTKAMESNSDDVASGLNLGYTYLSLGNASKASRIFRRIVKRCNECPVAQTGYAISLMRSGKHRSATTILERLSNETPDNLVAKYELARYHFRVSRNSADANNILREVFEKTNKKDRNEVLKRAKMLWKDQNKHNLF